MKFEEWLNVFIEEKEINIAKTFEFIINETWNYLPLEVVIEFIKSLPYEQQIKIKDTIVKIDFMNGDVYHYFKYLARGMVLLEGITI